MLDGVDGAKASDDSWPAFHKSFVHASPVLFDFDENGVLDILIATYNGEILVVKDTVGDAWLPRPAVKKSQTGVCGLLPHQRGARCLTPVVPPGRGVGGETGGA